MRDEPLPPVALQVPAIRGEAVEAQLVEAAVPIMVYGDAIDDLTETGLRAQGVREVANRRRLLADPSAFLPLIA